MAKDDQQPQFLGGGPKFNAAGAQPREEEVTDVPLAPPPYRARTRVIIIALVVLIGLLYAIMAGPNGTTILHGRGGVSPTQHVTGPVNGNVP